ncbi:hypothetical protein FGB62_4g447 [Gracilaria domingensis]|nr:hypothetical protein FGB62_4g447 [Gracilaria domingensis]
MCVAARAGGARARARARARGVDVVARGAARVACSRRPPHARFQRSTTPPPAARPVSRAAAAAAMDDLQMEHGFLKAPWEVLVRNFRAGHKPLAKEVDVFSNAVSQLMQNVSERANNPATASQPLIRPESISALENKLTGLKRKLETARSNDEQCMRRCFMRIRHLQTQAPPTPELMEYPPHVTPQQKQEAQLMDVDSSVKTASNGNTSDVPAPNGSPRALHHAAEDDEHDSVAEQAEKQSRWEKMRLNRALVDYMLREGMYDTAETLAKSHGIEQIVDMNIFRESRVVIEALRRRDCSEGLRWCNENKRRLQKVQSKLEFRLRLQEFVEYARAGRKTDAITYMKKYLSSANCDNERLLDIQRFMTLLCFDPSTSCQPYKDMFSERKWHELEVMFKHDNYRLHGLTRESTIEIMLKAGLASLKTRKCGTEAERKPNCPTCVEPFLSLAQSLPRGRHENSVLVCSISGEIMDENNLPMALPNGNVYSTNAVRKIAEENSGEVIDPRNGDKARLKDLRKIFIM